MTPRPEVENRVGDSPSPEGLRRVILNGVHLLLAYVLPRLFTIASVVVAARILGTRDFGAYGTAAAYAVILSIVSTLGLMPLLIRDLAREPERAATILRSAHLLKTGANLVMVAALYVVAAFVLRFPAPVVAAAVLLGIAYGLGSYVENLAAYFQARERMEVWTQASALFGLVTGVLGVFLVVRTSSVVWFCAAPIAGQAVSLAWLIFRMPASVRAGPRTARADVAALARAMVPYAVAFVALTAYYKIDVLLLTRWRPFEDVGIYTAAYKFVDVAQALAGIAVVAVYPRLSRLARTRGGDARWAGTRVTELVLLTAIPCGALLWIVKGPTIDVLYGPAYGAAIAVLGPLALAIIPLGLNILGGYMLSATEKMSRVALLYGVALPANVGLNVLLIPPFGPVGAAFAKLTTEVLLAMGFLSVLSSEAAAFPGRRALGLMAGALALFWVVALAPDPSGGLAGALVYVGLVALLYWRGEAMSAKEVRSLRLAVASTSTAPVGAPTPPALAATEVIP